MLKIKSLLIYPVFISAIVLLFWVYLFITGAVTLSGVPASIIFNFLQDPPAITAFLTQDKQMLHDRLKQLNVETAIKAYYRPQISDEIELDRYIHQLFYDQTGYVGKKYRLTPDKKLVLTESGLEILQQELTRD